MPTATKLSYYIDGLDCANCAAKIEAKVRALPGVSGASVNLMAKKFDIELYNAADKSEIIKRAQVIIDETEPGAGIRLYEGTISYAAGSGNPRSKHPHNDKIGLKFRIIRLIAAAITLSLAFILDFPFDLALFLAAYIIAGGDVLLRAGRNMLKGKIFDENFLMTIATIGAFAIGEYPEGVAVMLFYQLGELFQEFAVERSRKSISAIMDIRPDTANILIENDIKSIDAGLVKVGDIIIVRPGERVPLDSVIIDGNSGLDTSALTGESLPRFVGSGDELLSGCVNQSGVIKARVTKPFSESTVSKILELVENAAGNKAKTEHFITKFAAYYTPAVVAAAVLIAAIPPLFTGAVFSEWLYRALVFLVISCPCALVISIPMGFFGGIGGASRLGILIKGGNYLEALASTETVVFDKTGTLTKGSFEVTKIIPYGINEKALIKTAAYAEYFSSHPIARAISALYKEPIDKDLVSDYSEDAGYGIEVTIDGRRVLAGNMALMRREGVEFSPADSDGTVVYIAADGIYSGCFIIEDTLRPDAQEAISRLKKLGVKKTVMLTGDSEAPGRAAANKLGLDKAYCGLLPGDKVARLEECLSELPKGKKLMFVGDGINDAPVLSRADIGAAMGGVGSDAAIEASDIVIMTDELKRLADAISISRGTRAIVKQNIILSLGVKSVVLLLGVLGYAGMWQAVFADVGVAVIAILNSLRALNVKKYR